MLSEDQIEIGRWKAMRLIKAHPPVDGWMKGAAMRFLGATKQPHSQPDAKCTKRMVDAWHSFIASYQVEPHELNLVDDDDT